MDLSQEHKSLIKILTNCEGILWEDSERNPIVKIIISKDNAPDIVILLENAWITDSLLGGVCKGTDPSIVNEFNGNVVDFELQLPLPTDDIAIVKDLATLLKYSRFLTEAPQKIFLINKKKFERPKEYIDAITFANVLKRISDHHETDNNKITCFFYDGVKIKIPLCYRDYELNELSGIKLLQESLTSPRLKERIRLLRASVVKVALTATSEQSTFAHLLKSFSRIKNTFEQDWNLYISDFSLDEILDELEEKILKIADKLNAALAELQKTMIAIPLAIIFAAPRIDTTNLQSLKNGIIVGSVWIFALFTWTFFSNHKRTLNFIEKEIEEQKEFVTEKHKGVANKIVPKFTELNDRCSHQKKYRMTIGSLMWVAVICISLMYFSPQLSPLADVIFTFLKNTVSKFNFK
nr:hypothetical protein [uncultured Desulfobacter sp.]